MSRTVADLEAEALQRGADERSPLVDRLLASLPVDPEVERDWSAKALRRAGELGLAAAAAVPSEDADSRARAVVR